MQHFKVLLLQHKCNFHTKYPHIQFYHHTQTKTYFCKIIKDLTQISPSLLGVSHMHVCLECLDVDV